MKKEMHSVKDESDVDSSYSVEVIEDRSMEEDLYTDINFLDSDSQSQEVKKSPEMNEDVVTTGSYKWQVEYEQYCSVTGAFEEGATAMEKIRSNADSVEPSARQSETLILKESMVNFDDQPDLELKVLNLDKLKTYKPKYFPRSIHVTHVTCCGSYKDPKGLLYSCSMCDEKNISMDDILKHVRKLCLHISIRSQSKKSRTSFDLPPAHIEGNELTVDLSFDEIEPEKPFADLDSSVATYSKRTPFILVPSDERLGSNQVTEQGDLPSIEIEQENELTTMEEKKCRYCWRSFKPLSRRHLVEHQRDCLKNFVKFTQQTGLPSKLFLQRKTKQDGNKCKYCMKSYKNTNRLISHEENCNKNSLNRFLCLICGKTFKLKKSLNKHVGTHRLDPVTCSVCDETFRNQMMLKTHMMLHTGEHPYKCKICDEGFIFYTSLKSHLLTKHNIKEKTNKCDQCNKGFETERTLQTHQNKAHSGAPEARHLCATCGKTFASSTGLSFHMITHRPRKHACEECGFKFHTKGMLKLHLMRHRKERNFVCETCGASFYIVTELKRHIFNHHTDELPERCTICNKGFKFPTRLKQHMILVHRIPIAGKKIHSCDICNQLFIDKTKLKDHMNIHTGERPYSCSHCDKRFRNQKTLVHHVKIHEGKDPKNSFGCSMCHKVFKSERTLQLHAFKDHVDCGQKQFSFPCDLCDKSYPQVWVLNRHRLGAHAVVGPLGDGRTVEQDMGCRYCDHLSSSRAEWVEHKKVHHSKERPSLEIACGICPDVLDTWNDFWLHRDVAHSPKCADGDRLIVCGVCDRSYGTKMCLYHHRRQRHSKNVKRFKCKICSKTFSSSSTLYQHKKNLHTNIAKLFACGTCGKSFKMKSSLLAHEQVHLDIMERQTFECEVCGRLLKTRWAHIVHMRIHDGIKPFECGVCGRSFTQSGDRNKHRITAHRKEDV